jgi:hypothetical protein
MTTVYFDYACAYSYRLQRLLDMADIVADWRPFSLVQAKRGEIEIPVWGMTGQDLPVSVLALAGHEFVTAQEGPGIKAYRQEVAHLFHEIEHEPTASQIWDLVEKFTGYAKDDLDLEAALQRVKVSHELAAAKRVFDTPTLFIDDADKPFFIRLEAIPETPQAAKVLWKALPKCAHYFPRPVTIEAAD